jgi:acetoin:2,6-dichlorophenolindophenol oxidoreductase subunit alpha
MHLASERVITATGVVGGPLALAVGHALRQPDGAVVVVFFGDGAVQTGIFHEAVNLAALWRVPVMFVCENNGWAEFSSREEHTTVGSVSRYGPLYGIPASEVDGADVEAVAEAAGTLLTGVRAGEGPALLECHIARLRSHYEGDWREQASEGDPLSQLAGRLVELGVDSGELERVRQIRHEEALALLAGALAEPSPDPAQDAALVFRRPL